MYHSNRIYCSWFRTSYISKYIIQVPGKTRQCFGIFLFFFFFFNPCNLVFETRVSEVDIGLPSSQAKAKFLKTHNQSLTCLLMVGKLIKKIFVFMNIYYSQSTNEKVNLFAEIKMKHIHTHTHDICLKTCSCSVFALAWLVISLKKMWSRQSESGLNY